MAIVVARSGPAGIAAAVSRRARPTGPARTEASGRPLRLRTACPATSAPATISAAEAIAAIKPGYAAKEVDAGRHPDQVALGEQLSDLDGVRRRALAQVVADDPEVETALVRGVAPDPADEHLVAPGDVGGERIEALARRVDDLDARSRPRAARGRPRVRAARGSAR